MPEWEPEIRARLAKLKLEPTREAAIVEELAQHLDDYNAELLVGGDTEAQAYRQTLVELSESELLARDCGAWSDKLRRNPSCSERIGGQG